VEKLIFYLEKVLLVNFSLFIIFIPYSKWAGKICLVIGGLLWLSINLIKYRFQFYRYLIPKTVLGKPLLFFYAALIISVISSIDFYQSQSVFFERYFYYFVFFLIGSYLAKNKFNLLVLIISLISGSIIIGIGGAWDYFHSPLGNLVRLSSSFGIHTGFTPFLVLGIPLFCMIGFFGKNKFLRLGSLVGAAILFFCLIMNASRGAWAAVLISLLVIFFKRNKRAALYALIIIVVGFVFLPPRVRQRAVTSVDISTWSERPEMYAGALEIFKDFPIFGVGLGECEKLIPAYVPEARMHLHIHNTFLEVLLETGMVGLLTFLWVFIVFFRSMFKSIKQCREDDIMAIQLGLTGGIFASLLFAMTCTIITVGFQDAPLFWFLMGMAMGIEGVEKKRIKVQGYRKKTKVKV